MAEKNVGRKSWKYHAMYPEIRMVSGVLKLGNNSM